MRAVDPLARIEKDARAWMAANGLLAIDGWLDPGKGFAVFYCRQGGPDGWRDYVQLAKSASSPFVAIRTRHLRRDDWEGQYDDAVATLHAERRSQLSACEGAIGHVASIALRAVAPAFGPVLLVWEAAAEWYDLIFADRTDDPEPTKIPEQHTTRVYGLGRKRRPKPE